MKYSRLIYKRKISLIGVLLFTIAFIFDTTYKITKYVIINLYKFTIWLIRYIKFIKAGYSYSDVHKLIMNMSGREFEVFICELFKATGKYKKVVLTQESNDGGKDIILTDKSGRITYVETKRWNEKFECGRVLLQKLAGSAYGDRVDKMIFITTSGYNKNAIEYAKKLDNLELWDMSNIMKLVTIVEQEKLSNILVKSLGVNSKVVNLQPCKL